MAIFANGQGYQTASVGTTPAYVFLTRGSGGTAIAAGVIVHNPTIANTGSVAVYIGNGTIATATGTASAFQLQGAGLALLPGQQMVIFGTAVAGTAATAGANTFDLFGCSGTTGVNATIEAGYATQTIVS